MRILSDALREILVTLSTMLVFRGLAFVLSDRGQSKRIPLAIQEAFRGIYWGKVITFGAGRTGFSILVPVVLFVGLFAVCLYLLRFTRFGHYTYAVGGNENAAWLTGVNTKLVKAATYVIVGITSAPLEPEVFRADRPFVFLIRDHRSGSILFLGRLVDPSP